MPYNIKVLNESALSSLEIKDIDRENKQIRNISLLGDFSKNNREYTNRALKSAVTVLEGSPAFYVHSSKDRNPKKELIGKFTNLFVKENRVKGTLNVLEKEASFIFDLAERMPELAGFSVDATVKYRREGKKEIIESFLKGKSVDLVTDPATVKGLFESIETEDNYMNETEVKEIQESLEKQDKQIKNLTESLEKERLESKRILEEAREEVRKLEQNNLVIRKLQESKMPEKAITELFKEQLSNAADEKAIDALIKDRKGILESTVNNIIKSSQGTVQENNQGIEDIMEEIRG